MRTKLNIPRFVFSLMVLLFLFTSIQSKAQTQTVQPSFVPIIAQHGINDTIICSAVVYEGDTIEAKILAGVYVWGKRNAAARAEWTRLRNAVYVTYPYAKRAGWVFSDIENHIAHNPNKQEVTRHFTAK